jgi:hypothetical protein
MGAACPFDKMILSFKKLAWFYGSKCNPDSWKNKIENISAMEAHDVGWPVLVTLQETIESILMRLAIS